MRRLAQLHSSARMNLMWPRMRPLFQATPFLNNLSISAPEDLSHQLCYLRRVEVRRMRVARVLGNQVGAVHVPNIVRNLFGAIQAASGPAGAFRNALARRRAPGQSRAR